MQKPRSSYFSQRSDGETRIAHYALPGLLPPGHTLALNLETRTLSLLSEGPELLMEQQFSVNEMSVIVPVLESYPHYCPYEVLLAYISANVVTTASIARCRQRLQEAQSRGTWQQELRPVRRALTSLRGKLYRFGLEISNIRERGCSLTGLQAASRF
jgi:hypothetical protein